MPLGQLRNLLYRLRQTVCPTPYERHSRGALCPKFSPEQLQREGYFSQCGQDKWVRETLLPGVDEGMFVDLGAHDGRSFSNSFFFERLGWKGLCVEPIPEIYERLDQNRTCIKVQGAIGAERGQAQFQILSGPAEMLSGLRETYDPRHLDRIRREQESGGGERQVIDVEVYSLADLLEQHGLRRVDYLSIDTEGAELSILQNFDFSRFDVRVIGLENNYFDHRIPQLLATQGYQFHSVVGDEFYLKR